ncbi:MAG: NAD(P)-dependent oxidoreductase [Zoogloeaceae bacterium]|nr:NAD(P)-dependent oxidoreductase [Zoogloeaceae bacterium]
MRVGFIGLGVMGRPMAEHLMRAGHTLGVWARRPESTAPLVAQGATAYDTPAALAAACDAVITIITNSKDVEGVAFGEHGLAAGLKTGAVHVDMSTIAPDAARDFARRYAEAGIDWVDAPVSGGEQAAVAGTLAIMAGAREAVFERVRPLFQALGKTIVRVGEPGAGQVAKACNQMVMVCALQACAEAMHLARAHNVDLAAVRTALMGGSAASRVMEVMGERMVQRDFSAGIQARLHHKDFGILLDEAVKIGAPLPIAAQTWQQLNALMAKGWGYDDTSSLLKVLEAATAGPAD